MNESIPNIMPDQVDSSLRWRCRRGMLELDLLLNQFINNDYPKLQSEEKKVLDRMLDYPDQLLFDLFLGHMQSSDDNVTSLVKKIRQSTTA